MEWSCLAAVRGVAFAQKISEAAEKALGWEADCCCWVTLVNTADRTFHVKVLGSSRLSCISLSKETLRKEI